MARMQANSEFFLAHLLPATVGHVPDVPALRAARPRIVVGAGDAAAGQMPHLAALALAERLGVTPVGFPGDHQGFATHPRPFAETIHQQRTGRHLVPVAVLLHGRRLLLHQSLPGRPGEVAG